MIRSTLIRRIFFLLTALCLLFSSCEKLSLEHPPVKDAWHEQADTTSTTEPTMVKAMWISQYDLTPICVQSGKQRPVADFTRRIQQMINNVVSTGINTLFVQVRPNGDSFYPSDRFPASHYAVGTIGVPFSYDPFGILLDTARAAGLSVHAWINPLRCFTDANKRALSSNHPLLSLCDGKFMVNVGGTWYLNPAEPAARRLITDGVTELLQRYPVDGIHIDDYFYPTADKSFDQAAYASYRASGGSMSLADFRRENISCLVKELYDTVHRMGEELQFGISPGGNMTRNYNELYADVARWCASSGYVDYICPQIYFGLEHASVPFDRVCREFSDMIQTDTVRLIIGMTLGKAYDGYYGTADRYAGSGATEWIEHQDVLSRCLEYAVSLPDCEGVAYFSYQFFFSPLDGAPTEATAAERERLLPLLRALS